MSMIIIQHQCTMTPMRMIKYRKTVTMMSPKDSRRVAALDLEDTDQVEDVHVNNEYVEPINMHLDEFEDDD